MKFVVNENTNIEATMKVGPLMGLNKLRLSLFVLLLLITGCHAYTKTVTTTSEPILTTSPTPESTQSTTSSSPALTPVILDTITSDFNGDGKEETAQLIYNSNLILHVGNKSLKVMGELSGLNDADNQVYLQKPSLTILQSNNQEKALLVSIVWATNKIGSNADLWVFDYRNQQLTMIWESTNSNPVGNILYHPKTNSVLIQIPDYNVNKEIILNENQKEWVSRLTENDDSASKHAAIATDLTEYKVIRNPNEQSELMTRRLLCFDSAPYYLTSMDTYYHLNGGKVVPIRAILENIDATP